MRGGNRPAGSQRPPQRCEGALSPRGGPQAAPGPVNANVLLQDRSCAVFSALMEPVAGPRRELAEQAPLTRSEARLSGVMRAAMCWSAGARPLEAWGAFLVEDAGPTKPVVLGARWPPQLPVGERLKLADATLRSTKCQRSIPRFWPGHARARA